MLNVNRIALKVIMSNLVATARRLGSLVHFRQFCYTSGNFVTLTPILIHFRQFLRCILVTWSLCQGHVVRVTWSGSRGQGHVVSLAWSHGRRIWVKPGIRNYIEEKKSSFEKNPVPANFPLHNRTGSGSPKIAGIPGRIGSNRNSGRLLPWAYCTPNADLGPSSS